MLLMDQGKGKTECTGLAVDEEEENRLPEFFSQSIYLSPRHMHACTYRRKAHGQNRACVCESLVTGPGGERRYRAALNVGRGGE